MSTFLSYHDITAIFLIVSGLLLAVAVVSFFSAKTRRWRIIIAGLTLTAVIAALAWGDVPWVMQYGRVRCALLMAAIAAFCLMILCPVVSLDILGDEIDIENDRTK